MRLYGLKTCDTCRKALKSLPDAQFVDVRNDGVPEPVLSQAFAQFGEALLNTRSTTWRGLDEKERACPAFGVAEGTSNLDETPFDRQRRDISARLDV